MAQWVLANQSFSFSSKKTYKIKTLYCLDLQLLWYLLHNKPANETFDIAFKFASAYQSDFTLPEIVIKLN